MVSIGRIPAEAGRSSRAAAEVFAGSRAYSFVRGELPLARCSALRHQAYARTR